LSGEHASPPPVSLLVKNNNQRTTNKITVVIPALLNVAQRNVSFGRQAVSLLITHCGAAAGRAMLVAWL
jgi:hypothetical protein